MQLIERYLTELETHLPKPQRNDIVVELRDDLVEQVQALGEAEDRAATPADESAVLAQLGHPLKLAGSYKSRRYLIGPALYPAYLQTLKIALIVVLALVVLASVAFGPVSSLGLLAKGVLNGFFEAGLWVVALVTLSFLSLESSEAGVDWYDNWTPADLREDTHALDYAGVVTNLVSEGFFLLWWNDLILNRWNTFSSADTGEISVALTSIWQTLYWPLNILFAAFFVVHVVVLARGTWPRWLSAVELVLCVGLLIVLGVLLSNQPLVNLSPVLAELPWFNHSLVVALLVVGGFTVWDGVLAYRRLR